jgi:hypothetical protein
MATIIARALTWPAMLPLVASELRLASSQRPSQNLVATEVQVAQSFHGTPHGKPGQAGQVGFLVNQLFPDGGTVLKHVGADAMLGFGVGGRLGIETDSFCGAAVIHGSG